MSGCHGRIQLFLEHPEDKAGIFGLALKFRLLRRVRDHQKRDTKVQNKKQVKGAVHFDSRG